MAARISALGLVTVSLRRSMTFMGWLHGHAGRHVWYSLSPSLPRLPVRSNAVPGRAARIRPSRRSKYRNSSTHSGALKGNNIQASAHRGGFFSIPPRGVRGGTTGGARRKAIDTHKLPLKLANSRRPTHHHYPFTLDCLFLRVLKGYSDVLRT